MSSLVSPRRSIKKCARDASRRKSSLTIDLNTPPVAPIIQPAAMSAVAQGPSTTAGTVVEVSAARLTVSPIDVEAIEDDDDVQMLSSPRAFTQERNQLRNRRMTVVLDEELELTIGTSVINVDDHLFQAPLNNFRRRQRLSSNMTFINCETYVNVDGNESAKRKRSATSLTIEPAKVAAKEPVFSCPICMSSLVDACSTICGHVFCQACIKQALRSQKKCPTCRRKLTINNFHRVFLPTNS